MHVALGYSNFRNAHGRRHGGASDHNVEQPFDIAVLINRADSPWQLQCERPIADHSGQAPKSGNMLWLASGVENGGVQDALNLQNNSVTQAGGSWQLCGYAKAKVSVN